MSEHENKPEKEGEYKMVREKATKPDIRKHDWKVLNKRLEELYPEIHTVWWNELKPEIERLWKIVSPWMGRKVSGGIFTFNDDGSIWVNLENVADYFVIMASLGLIKSRRI